MGFVITDIDPESDRLPWQLPWVQSGALDGHSLGATLFGRRRVWTAMLPPDALPPPFRAVFWQERVTRSQLDILDDCLRSGLDIPDGTVLLAREGVGLHGHYDRSWNAVPGNLHATVHLAGPFPAAETGMGLAALPVVALREAAALLCPARASQLGIKWINDIQLGGAKIGGALSRCQSHSDNFRHALLGLGLNLAAAPPVDPDLFVPTAGSLGVVGDEGDAVWCGLQAVLDRLASGLADLRSGGGARLAARYRAGSSLIGRRIRLHADGPRAAGYRLLAQGTVTAIGDDLSLHVDNVRHLDGRLAFEEDCVAGERGGASFE